MNTRSYGLIIEELAPTDYVAGDGQLTGEVINPTGDWTPFLPIFEHQAPRFETNSCASQGTLTAFETLYKFLYGDEANLSDRFLAKISGTDPKRGNSPQRVAQAFRSNWSTFEEDWPMDGVKTVEEYYQEPPDLLYSKAELLRGEDMLGYEAIVNPTKQKLQEALTKGVVCMSVFAWTTDENGLYYRPQGFTDNHWIFLVKIKPNGNYLIMDSYSPSLKEIRADFIPQIAYRYTLNEELTDAITILLRKIKQWLGL